MCDTFVATPKFTANGTMVFAKNSDREPNEAQALVRVPRRTWTEPTVRVTYSEVPQVSETNEMILSRPFHMWGAEMGANEHGLVIGNEAVFTKVPFPKKNTGLTGMDMLRLALERKATAPAALEFITELVERYSQDACGGYRDQSFYYHSSFIIADAREAYVLETAGHQWAAQRVKGFRSISNGLTIEEEYDLASKGLIDYARERGWARPGESFNFRKAYSERFLTYFSKCAARRAISTGRGEAAQSKLDAAGAMAILRSHGEHEGPDFVPARSDMASLCLHATGLLTPSQTTGSLVAELRTDRPGTYWFTGTAAPCLSTFKPCFLPGRTLLSGEFPEPGATPDESMWWRHERLHRRALRNYPEILEQIETERDALEASFLRRERELFEAESTPDEREAFAQECLQGYDAQLNEWLERTQGRRIKPSPFAPLYRAYWRKQNKAAGL